MNMKVHSFKSYTLALLVLLIFTSASAPKHEKPQKLTWKERVLFNILQKKIAKQQKTLSHQAETPQKLKWKERVLLNILQKKIEKQQRKSLSPQPKKSKQDKKPVHWANIVALVCGILGFLTGFTAIFAVIFGIIGVVNSGKGTDYSGEGMGIAGIVTGALVILLFIAILIIFASIFL